MSYLVLARKWRPRRFADLVGQDHVVRALTNALGSGRIGHAFLFSGSRGVGKTTVGRLLAKGLNCETGVTAEPCGECDACRSIEESRFVDLIEVDAASRTKVDDRDLLDNVQYLPTVGRYKVYLVDEVHMLSNHSFNALLKTLEEPPDHVKFVFATTEPARLPATILSRCLQFELKRIPAGRIRERMAAIAEAEGIPAESDALELLARAADGSLRDGLSLLDQGINYAGGRLEGAAVREMLGTVSRDRVLALLEAVAARDGAAALERLTEVADSGMDLDGALAEILGLLHRLAVMQTVPGREPADEALVAEERQRLQALAETVPPEDVQLFYQVGVQGRADLAAAPDPRVGLEMTVLRMVAFDPFEADGGGGGEGPGSGSRGESGATDAGSGGGEIRGAAVEATDGGGEKGSAGTEQAVSEWESVLAALELPPAWRSLLSLSVPQELSAERVRLAFPSEHLTTAGSERFRSALTAAFESYFGSRPAIRIEEQAEGGEESPAAARERRAGEVQAAAEEAVANDPNVRILRERYGARIEAVEPEGDGSADQESR